MAFTRSFLKTMGLTEEQVQAVVDAHLEVVNSLKQERDTLKEQADKVPELQKALDGFKNGEDYKAKYEKEHGDFEEYKAKVTKAEQTAKVKAAYRKLLSDQNIPEKRLDAIIRLTDFEGIKLDKEGKLTEEDKLVNAIKRDWGEYITETHERGAKVDTPLSTGKGTKTKEEIMAIKDTGERQKAIAENHELFGI